MKDMAECLKICNIFPGMFLPGTSLHYISGGGANIFISTFLRYLIQPDSTYESSYRLYRVPQYHNIVVMYGSQRYTCTYHTIVQFKLSTNNETIVTAFF